MNAETSPPVWRPRARLAACVAVPLVIGQSVPGLVFALDPSAATGISPAEVGIPVWWFVVVFTIIYAGMGVAFWMLAESDRHLRIPRGVAMSAIAVGFVQTLVFWFSRGLAAILVADLNSVLVALAVTALVFRALPRAGWWLLPWCAWMIATTVIKFVAIAG